MTLWQTITTVASDAVHDLRHAVRVFARQRVAVGLAALGLTTGLGIAISAFTIVHAATVHQDGLRDSETVPGFLRLQNGLATTAWHYSEFTQLRDSLKLTGVAAVLPSTAPVRATTMSEPEHVRVAFVSGDFFRAAGGGRALGRLLEPADDGAASHVPVVLSFTYWSSRFQGDTDVVGRSVRVGAVEGTVVGVAARGFTLPGGRQVWMPLRAVTSVRGGARAMDDLEVEVFGRLLPTSTIARAQSEAQAVVDAIPAKSEFDTRVRLELSAEHGLGRADAAKNRSLGASVLVVIALILAVTCANVAVVLIATTASRQREIGIRAALGAPRARLMRQFAAESTALGLVCGLVGLGLSMWLTPVVARAVGAPPDADLSPGVVVYLFGAAAALLTSTGAGLVQVWYRGRVDLAALTAGADAQGEGPRPRRLRSTMVVAQVTLSVALLALSAFFVRASLRAAATGPGFDPTALWDISFGDDGSLSADPVMRRETLTEAEAALRKAPGVLAMTHAEFAPLSDTFRAAAGRAASRHLIYFNRTDAAYFETIGLPLIAGRGYTAEEVKQGAPVVVISDFLAKAYWGDRSPVGAPLPEGIPVEGVRPTVIGVVGDLAATHLRETGRLAIYQPQPTPAADDHLIVRLAPGTPISARWLSEHVGRGGAGAVGELRMDSIEARLEAQVSAPRVLAGLSVVVGLAAVALCAVGLFGLTTLTAVQRMSELALRAALGAQPAALRHLLFWNCVRPVIVGVVSGAALVVALGQVVSEAEFFGIRPDAPAVLGAAGLILVVICGLAILVPAGRASRVDARLSVTR